MPLLDERLCFLPSARDSWAGLSSDPCPLSMKAMMSSRPIPVRILCTMLFTISSDPAAIAPMTFSRAVCFLFGSVIALPCEDLASKGPIADCFGLSFRIRSYWNGPAAVCVSDANFLNSSSSALSLRISYDCLIGSSFCWLSIRNTHFEGWPLPQQAWHGWTRSH